MHSPCFLPNEQSGESHFGRCFHASSLSRNTAKRNLQKTSKFEFAFLKRLLQKKSEKRIRTPEDLEKDKNALNKSIDRALPKKSLTTGNDLDKIIKKLSKYDSIANHTRDYIVTSGYVFSIMQVCSKQEVELLDNVKNGMFMVEHDLPRFLIEESQLIAIELWRKNQ